MVLYNNKTKQRFQNIYRWNCLYYDGISGYVNGEFDGPFDEEIILNTYFYLECESISSCEGSGTITIKPFPNPQPRPKPDPEPEPEPD